MDSVFTVFVDNLPVYVDHRWLRKVFQWYGKVLNSFVSRKRRNGINANFGFIRFGRRDEAITAIRYVNRAFVGSHRLFVKMAQSRRSDQFEASIDFLEKGEGYREKKWEPKPAIDCGKHEMRKTFDNFSMNRTFADVVRERKTSDEEGMVNSHREIFKAEVVNDKWLEKCVVGHVKQMELINGLQNAFILEGVLDIRVAPMGGSLVLLEFESVEDKKCYTEGNASWLSNWFVKLEEWRPASASKERLIWLSIKGIPLHAWEVQNFKMIAERFGDVIAIDEHTSAKKILDLGRVLISTKLLEPIRKELILEVDSTNFLIDVKEEMGVKFQYSYSSKNDMAKDAVEDGGGADVVVEESANLDQVDAGVDDELAILNQEDQAVEENGISEKEINGTTEKNLEVIEDSEDTQIEDNGILVENFEMVEDTNEAGKQQLNKGFDESSEEILLKDLVKRKFKKNRLWKGRYSRLSDVLVGNKRGKYEKKKKNKVIGLKKKKKVDGYEVSTQSEFSTSIEQDPNACMESCNEQVHLEDFRDDIQLEEPSNPLPIRCRILERDTEGILNVCELMDIECVENRENIRKFAAYVHARERPSCCC